MSAGIRGLFDLFVTVSFVSQKELTLFDTDSLQKTPFSIY